MGKGQTVTDAGHADKAGGPDNTQTHITGTFTGLTVVSAAAAAAWLTLHAGFTVVHHAGDKQRPEPKLVGRGFMIEFITAELRAPNGGIWWLTEFLEPPGPPIQPRISDTGRPSLGIITNRIVTDRERLRLAGVRWFSSRAAEITEGRYAGGWQSYGALTERTPLPKLGISLHQLHPTEKVT